MRWQLPKWHPPCKSSTASMNCCLRITTENLGLHIQFQFHLGHACRGFDQLLAIKLAGIAGVGIELSSLGNIKLKRIMATHGCSASTADDVPGGEKTLTSKVLDAGAGLLQKLKPIQAFQQHICTWAIFSHDMKRKIETHHYAARLNDDFLQCAVYDSDQPNARLIGVEYVISEKVFKTLPKEEKQLWHSHDFEIKEGLWVNPGVPEMVQKQELKSLANTYGKFWCTWQFDRGDALPLGAPALMMSPQEQEPGRIPEASVAKRDAKYGISSSSQKQSRADIPGVERVDPDADRWKHTGKGWAVELVDVLMALG